MFFTATTNTAVEIFEKDLNENKCHVSTVTPFVLSTLEEFIFRANVRQENRMKMLGRTDKEIFGLRKSAVKTETVKGFK